MWSSVCDVFKEESEENSMSKNLIPLIAKELGVEIGEEFKLKGKDYKYRFSDDEFQWYAPTNGVWTILGAKCDFCDLVHGWVGIIKLPFEPHKGEYYWTYNSDDFSIVETDWAGLAGEYCKKACGCIFRTEAEAIKARPAKYKELTGKEWESR